MAVDDTMLRMQAKTQEKARPQRLSKGDRMWRVFVLAILFVGAAVMLLPFLWLVSSSFKNEVQIFQFPPQWIPDPIRWQNYIEAWTKRPFMLYLRNTLFILILNEIAIIGSASLCGYGFARIDFPGRNLLFGILLATMMIPGVVLMVPTFVLFARLRWVDTFLPLVIPPFFGGGAFFIFLFRQFFRSLPAELADAARIDGCNEFDIYWRIMLPLAKPAIATVAVFTFIGTWNDFMGPLLYLSKSPEKFTVALGLALFRSTMLGRTRWDLLMAASTIMIIPVLIVFFLAQKYFVQGIATTGIKG